LTVEEVIVAKDFGSLLPGLIAVERLNNQFLHALVPRKILVALATQWGCNGGGRSIGRSLGGSIGRSLGGSFFLDRARDLGRTLGLATHDEAPLKRQKLEVELKLEELANEDGDTSAPGPSKAVANHRTPILPVKPSSVFSNEAEEVSETCNAQVPEYL
jgi:hypothetical protein